MSFLPLLRAARLLANSPGTLSTEHLSQMPGDPACSLGWGQPGPNPQFHILLKSKGFLKLTVDPRVCSPR